MDWKTEDTTSQYDRKDIDGNKTAAVFSYIGVLVLVPILAAKGSKFAKFHANQGLALLLAWLVYNFSAGIAATALLSVSWGLYPAVRVIRLLGILYIAFAVLGIKNAAEGKAKELPLIGKLRLLR